MVEDPRVSLEPASQAVPNRMLGLMIFSFFLSTGFIRRLLDPPLPFFTPYPLPLSTGFITSLRPTATFLHPLPLNPLPFTR